MMGIWDKETHGLLDYLDIEKMLHLKIYEQLEIKYGKNQASELHENILKHTNDFFDPIYSQSEKEVDSGNFANLMDKILTNIVDGNKVIVPAVEPPAKNQTCLDMVKVFWAIP
jgi:hypothetical protein